MNHQTTCMNCGVCGSTFSAGDFHSCGPAAAPLLLTVEDVAKALALSTDYVRLLVRQGKVRATRFGRAYRIPAAELARLAAEGVT